MAQLILLRHGQSLWNLENRFTGGVDVPLTKVGESEALQAGRVLKTFQIDKVFTSTLKRAIDSADIILKCHGLDTIDRIADSSLNERNYGDLQGLNKEETAQRYGVDQVRLWRRSYTTRPPHGESLEDTAARTLPFFYNVILPDVAHGKNVLVVAHGNSLRSIVMSLDKLTSAEVVDLNIPTGIPLVYEIGDDGSVLSRRYLSVTDTKFAEKSAAAQLH